MTFFTNSWQAANLPLDPAGGVTRRAENPPCHHEVIGVGDQTAGRKAPSRCSPQRARDGAGPMADLQHHGVWRKPNTCDWRRVPAPNGAPVIRPPASPGRENKRPSVSAPGQFGGSEYPPKAGRAAHWETTQPGPTDHKTQANEEGSYGRSLWPNPTPPHH